MAFYRCGGGGGADIRTGTVNGSGNVVFDKPFAAGVIPSIYITPHSNITTRAYTAVHNTSIYNVSNTGFSLQLLYSTNTTTSEAFNGYVKWVAVAPTN